MTPLEKISKALNDINEAREEFSKACDKLDKQLRKIISIELQDAYHEYLDDGGVNENVIKTVERKIAETNVRLSAINGIKCLM